MASRHDSDSTKPAEGERRARMARIQRAEKDDAAPAAGDALAPPRSRITADDRQAPREFLEPLFRLAQRDAQLAAGSPLASQLLANAAEIAEFGLRDRERALAAASAAAAAPSPDGRAFATLRRAARDGRGDVSLSQIYEMQAESDIAPDEQVLALLGRSLVGLRAGEQGAELLRRLASVNPLLERTSNEVVALWRSVTEDAFVAAGFEEKAARMRAARWNALNETGNAEPAALSHLALAVAALAARADLASEEVLSWFDVAFRALPSMETLRPLLRFAHERQRDEMAVELLSELARRGESPDARAAALYRAGMLVAWRLQDADRGLELLGDSLKSGAVAPIAASSYLSLARSSRGRAVPDEVVHALSARLEFAASSMERADLLTQLAERFEYELELTDAAVEMANEALQECATWTPAMRLLGAIYTRSERWQELVELGEAQLRCELDADEKRRLHERIAETADERLHDASTAERHLRSALRVSWTLPAVRRLARMLHDQQRWQELYEHLQLSAERIAIQRERTWLLEQAAEVAERRMRDDESAIATLRQLLELTPASAAAIASLERIYSRLARWQDMLELYQHELNLCRDEEHAARVAILCRCADVAADKLADSARAEDYYVAVLQIDPLNDDALRGLGVLLKAQARWQDLVDMTRRELEHATTEQRKARCLRQIGELYVHQLSDHAAAIEAYRSLGQLGKSWHEEALLWLERLFEATREPERRLKVQHARREACSEAGWSARLAYRMAEVLEWELQRGGDALRMYLRALDEPMVRLEVVAALDRLWNLSDVDEAARTEALMALSELRDESASETNAAIFEFLLARRDALPEAIDGDALLRRAARLWPDEPYVIESLALQTLRQGDFVGAEALRVGVFRDDANDGRDRWRELDAVDGFDATELDTHRHPVLGAWLLREQGERFGFPFAEERSLYLSLANAELTLAELLEPAESWSLQRLRQMAARALREHTTLREAWTEFAAASEHSLVRMQAFMEAAEEEGVDATVRMRWLRDAANEGHFDSPLREELYRALHAHGDLEGLAAALGAHINAAQGQGALIARLSLRRGRALARIGRVDEAIQALRTSTVHDPANADVALEKSVLERESGDLRQAATTLEDVLQSGCPQADRAAVLGRLAEIHSLEGGDRERALSALEEVYQLSGGKRDAALRLAAAHQNWGDPQRAADLLESALGDDVSDESLRHWLNLSRLLSQRLNRIAEAASVLWRVFDALRGRDDVLRALKEHYTRFGGADEFARELQRRLDDRDNGLTQPTRAHLWLYLGEMLLRVLQQHPQAEQAFASAIELGASRGDAMRRRALAVAGQEGRERQAATLLTEALGEEDYDVSTLDEELRELDRLLATVQDTTRLRSVRQLRVALGDAIEAPAAVERRTPGAPLSEQALWATAGSRLIVPQHRVVLEGCSALADKVLRNRNVRRQLDLKRFKPDEHAEFFDSLRELSELIGANIPRLHVAQNARHIVVLDSDDVAVPLTRLEEGSTATKRYLAGWIAALSRSGLAAFHGIEDHEVMEFLDAIAGVALDHDVDPANPYVSEIGGLLNAGARRAAANALREYPEILEANDPGWSRGLGSFCHRVGATWADDPGVALREELQAQLSLREGEAVQASALGEYEGSRDLCHFALSNEFATLRSYLGIGSRRGGY